MAAGPPTLTLARVAWRRLRHDWLLYLPTTAGLAVALALAAAVSLTQAFTDEASLQSELSHLGPDSVVEVRHTAALSQSDYDGFKREVNRAAREDMGGLLRARSYSVTSGGLSPRSVNGALVTRAQSQKVLRMTAYEDLDGHVNLLSGSWPAPALAARTWPATIQESTATETGLKPGDVECLHLLDGPPTADDICFQVTGVWRPKDLSDPFWGANKTPGLAFVVRTDVYFTILKGQTGVQSDASFVFTPDLASIRAADLDQVLDRLHRLRGLFSVRLPNTTINTRLDESLDAYSRSAQVAAFALRLVAAQLLLIALVCVAFLTAQLLDQQRAAISVWRTRGWGWTGIAGLLIVELTVAAAAAVPVGIAAGGVGSHAVARAVYGGWGTVGSDLQLSRLWQPVAIALAAGLVLIWTQALLAARRGIMRSRPLASRPPEPWWRRRYLDLVLGLLALPLLAQSRLLGGATVRAAGAADQPFDLILPGLAMVLIALAALRLMPVFAAGAGLVRQGVGQRLASLQLGRAPAQHVQLALLLTLTVGLGVFAAAYATTSARNARDRAAYMTGADYRAVYGGSLPLDLEQASVPGAAATSAVYRGYGRPGASAADGMLLGVDPYTFSQVGWSRPDLNPRPLAQLLKPLVTRESGGLQLAGGTGSLSIWVMGAATGGRLEARLSDAEGRSIKADFGALDFEGWRQLKASIPKPAPGAERLRFRELIFTPVSRAGTVAISTLEGMRPDGAYPVQDFSAFTNDLGRNFLFPGAVRWWRDDPETGARLGAVQTSDRFLRDGKRTAPIYLQPGWLPAHLRPTGMVLSQNRFGPAAIPALTSDATLTRLGLKVGDAIDLKVDNVVLVALLVGVSDYFPTLYAQGGPMFILARDPLLATLGEQGHQRPWSDELWVAARPGQQQQVATALRASRDAIDVLDRVRLEDEAARAPIQLGLASNLILGFTAAMVLALIGFAVHFILAARARITDYSILLANGMSTAQVRRSLGMEQLVLTAFGVVTGAALGALLAYSLLPGLQVGSSLADTVPPTIVTIDPRLIVGILVVVAAGTLMSGRVIGLALGRLRLMAALRSL
jgi:hypothetical protein